MTTLEAYLLLIVILCVFIIYNNLIQYRKDRDYIFKTNRYIDRLTLVAKMSNCDLDDVFDERKYNDY